MLGRLPITSKITCLLFSLVLSTGTYAQACDDNYVANTPVRDDILILVNDNSVDSCEVGLHYAQARNVPKENIIHIASPALYKIEWDDFRSMMDQIIFHLQQPSLLKPDAPPAPVCAGANPLYCSESADHLRSFTKIKYIVTTKGVPTNTQMPMSPLIPDSGGRDTHATSVDNHLKFWLLRYFPEPSQFNFQERENDFSSDGRTLRIVDVEHDGEFIVGRIDGYDLNSAKVLVDRTIRSEQQGIFGTIYGSTKFKLPQYQPDAPWAENAWRYQFGLVGESDPVCRDLSYSSNSGQAPSHCKAKFGQPGSGPAVPGNIGSRVVDGSEALVYLGHLQGHRSGGNQGGKKGDFRTILNIVKASGCQPRLCKDHASPTDCRLSSTDPLRELNTECVGVNEGFIGYNHQSYPMANFSLWPTSWTGPRGHTVRNLAYPRVRDNDGHGVTDSNSIWFTNLEDINTPTCYPVGHSDFSQLPSVPCANQYHIRLHQDVDDAIIAEGNQYRLQFWYKSNVTSAKRLNVTLKFSNPAETNFGQVIHQVTLSNVSDWTLVGPLDYTVPTLSGAANRLSLEISSIDNTTDAEIGLDDFSLIDLGTSIEQLNNGQFNLGHEQDSAGDHAAMFISRLGGVGFWGSVSHYQSGGHSFGGSVLRGLYYYFKGLPLGDAVWFGDSNNSGIFYGDPVYSPLAVRFDDLNLSIGDTALTNSTISLFGQAFNGRDNNAVNTTYYIDYCNQSHDFYVCDDLNAWNTSNISGSGQYLANGTALQFGDWDTTGLTPGDYLLRLRVETQNVSSGNPQSGKTQSFNDYYALTLYNANDDDDGDLLSNASELALGTDPTDPDSDDDGLNDFEENQTGADPLRHASEVDSDDDGMHDDWELVHGTSALIQDALVDLDGDGVDNIIEFLQGTLPTDNTSKPCIKTWYVDSGLPASGGDGSVDNPFKTIRDALASPSVNHGDTLFLKFTSSDTFQFYYDPTPVDIDKSVKIIGSDEGIIYLFAPLYFSGVKWGGIYNVNLAGSLILTENSEISNFSLERNIISTQRINLFDAKRVLIKNNILLKNVATQTGIDMGTSSHSVIENNTIVNFDSGVGVDRVNATEYLVQNNIFWNNVNDLAGFSTSDSIRNNILGTGLFDGINENFNADPLFLNTSDFNSPDFYRLTSFTSPAIDKGHRLSRFENEPNPLHGSVNGGRINLGAFGNTSGAAPSLDSDSDGISDQEEIEIGTSPISPSVDDLDVDNLPDDWEFARCNNQNCISSNDDPDGDGHTNYMEYINGSLPQENQSFRLGAWKTLTETFPLPVASADIEANTLTSGHWLPVANDSSTLIIVSANHANVGSYHAKSNGGVTGYNTSEIAQIIDVTQYASDIDLGLMSGDFSAFGHSTQAGWDYARIRVEFLDENEALIADGGQSINDDGDGIWKQMKISNSKLPFGTRKIRLVIGVVRTGGNNTDALVDGQVEAALTRTEVVSFNPLNIRGADIELDSIACDAWQQAPNSTGAILNIVPSQDTIAGVARGQVNGGSSGGNVTKAELEQVIEIADLGYNKQIEAGLVKLKLSTYARSNQLGDFAQLSIEFLDEAGLSLGFQESAFEDYNDGVWREFVFYSQSLPPKTRKIKLLAGLVRSGGVTTDAILDGPVRGHLVFSEKQNVFPLYVQGSAIEAGDIATAKWNRLSDGNGSIIQIDSGGAYTGATRARSAGGIFGDNTSEIEQIIPLGTLGLNNEIDNSQTTISFSAYGQSRQVDDSAHLWFEFLDENNQSISTIGPASIANGSVTWTKLEFENIAIPPHSRFVRLLLGLRRINGQTTDASFDGPVEGRINIVEE